MFSLYQKNYHNAYGGEPKPDKRDLKIAEELVNAFNEIPGPRVGDFVILPDGKYQRFAHEWPDLLQTCDEGSFYIGKGYVSMSGGLHHGYKKEQIISTPETRPGHFWFFHHDDACGSNSVGLKIDCRVFQVDPSLLQDVTA
jgi:hypothetical protein